MSQQIKVPLTLSVHEELINHLGGVDQRAAQVLYAHYQGRLDESVELLEKLQESLRACLDAISIERWIKAAK
jgi:hypothetical protein